MPIANFGGEQGIPLSPSELEAIAQACYEACQSVKPLWSQLGSVTRSVWVDKARRGIRPADYLPSEAPGGPVESLNGYGQGVGSLPLDRPGNRAASLVTADALDSSGKLLMTFRRNKASRGSRDPRKHSDN